MTRTAAFASLIVIAAAPVAAHPHAWVDQQVIVSLERGSVVVEYRVVPSFKDGTHMFDHLDVNHDGLMSAAEKRAYAEALVRSTRMTVDGVLVSLRPYNVTIPARSTMSGGAGLMAVRSGAPLRLSPDRPHRISLNISFGLFKKGWFIQPFYGASLRKGSLPTLRRSSSSKAVTITVPATMR